MISVILKKSPLFWLVFHVILGAVSTLTPWILIAWFYIVLLASLVDLVRKTEGSFVPLVFLIAYATSFELLARMSGTSPFIPYELGKYLLFALLILGIIKGYRNGRSGWVMLILLFPGILVDMSGLVGFKNIVFNLLGPVNVALAIIFFKGQNISETDFRSLIRLIMLPMISILAFVIIKTPDFEDVEFSLGANFETSGGWGSNQVSTVLGLGAVIVYISWRNKWQLSGYRWLDLVLLLLFTLRGLLTFSRGGIIGGALGIGVLLFYEARARTFQWSMKRILINLAKITPVVVLFVFLFQYADRISQGQLVLRYQGETPGTVGGYRQKDLNVFTSNRLNVFKDDLQLWKEHWLLGVGVGASSYLRENTRRVAAHVELSRLISEHGLLGAIYFIILLGLGYKILKRAPFIFGGPILLALFLIALFTTFHSAMRTFVSPMLIGLSMLTVYEVTEEDQT